MDGKVMFCDIEVSGWFPIVYARCLGGIIKQKIVTLNSSISGQEIK